MMILSDPKPLTSHSIIDSSQGAEINAHKNANKKVMQQAKNANKRLKKLLDENGFTVKIVLAMGAKQTRGEQKS